MDKHRKDVLIQELKSKFEADNQLSDFDSIDLQELLNIEIDKLNISISEKDELKHDLNRAMHYFMYNHMYQETFKDIYPGRINSFSHFARFIIELFD